MIRIVNKIFEFLCDELPEDLNVKKEYEIPKSEFGDLAFPCFSLAKKFRKNHVIIAAELSEKLNEKLSDFGSFSGNGGYLNFRFSDDFLARGILSELMERKEKFGWEENTGKTVIIDFSSPNIAKPFSIGHLRSTSIGNALRKILIANGMNVIGVNHLGDWGTQFGKLIYAYRKWGNESIFNEKGVDYLLELYVKFHNEAEKDPSLDEFGREEFKKLEHGDTENRKLWEKFRDISLDEFKKIYERLGIEFDHFTGESFYEDKLEDTIKRLFDKGLLEKSEGAEIVNLNDQGMPPALIRKNDGSTLYLTRDLAAAIYRKEVLKADLLLYVVGSEQKLHFNQLKAVVKKLGYDWYENIHHIDFGLFRFSGEKMSTRKGKIIFMKDVLDEAKNTILNIIKEKNPELYEKERIAEEVGAGAIIFGDLVNERIKNITFSWEKMLQFEGDTGPYVQYAHARCKSILRKSGFSENEKFNIPEKISEYERELLREIMIYSVKINKVSNSYKPHYIAESLLKITKSFNRFYQNCPVINAKNDLKDFRLMIVFLTATILKSGMSLLGMRAPDEM